MKKLLLRPLGKPTKATILIPGSKSYTNRALILASLIENEVVIKNPLFSNDTDAMISCLQTLGISCHTTTDTIVVTGSIQDVSQKTFRLNAKLSGTTIRFILALCTIIPGIKILQGEKGLNKRPIGNLVDALVNLGAVISYEKEGGYPPIRIRSSKLTQDKTTVKGNLSSQFLSALLMIAPVAGIRDISVSGDQVSRPYIDMTLSIMKTFGASVTNTNYTSYEIPQMNYSQKTYTIEGDFSAAGYFAAIAVLTKSTITLTNLNRQSVQGDKEFIRILEQMGNTVIWTGNKLSINGKKLKSVIVDMHNCPDQIQTLAVLASFAEGVTEITGIKTLRVKETDRVHALVTELEKMGISVDATENKMTIHGGHPKSAKISTYGDHRMAMAFAVAGTKLSGIEIENPSVVNKTFPTFWDKLKELGVKI